MFDEHPAAAALFLRDDTVASFATNECSIYPRIFCFWRWSMNPHNIAEKVTP